MKFITIGAALFILSGCVFNRYYEFCDAGCKFTESIQRARAKQLSAAQLHTNNTWGTTKLTPISVRNIPKEAYDRAKCFQGNVKYCKKD